MRTTTRLCLVASIVAAVALASVPVANAANRPGSINLGKAAHHNDANQNKKINKAQKKANKAHRRIANIKEWNQSLSDWNTSQQSTIDSLESTVGAIVAGVPQITSALTQLQGGLLAIQAALEGPIQTAFNDIEDGFGEIEDALNDTTTGLVGLNLARPQFGVFSSTGTFLGGTGPINGSDPPFGPSGNAVQGPGAAPDVDGAFVVDFENDVSQRMYTVNVFPLGPTGAGGGGAAATASAVNCASSPTVAGLCGVVQGTGPDGATNKVLVQYGNGSSGGPANGFSVTALSG